MTRKQEAAYRELSDTIIENLINIMEKEGVSFAQLAGRLNVSRAHVTTTLKPGHNMTIKTLIKFLQILGWRVKISFEKIPEKGDDA